MHGMTAANLRSAYGGESMAHMRYLAWGDKAEKDGLPNVARLFRAIAYAEQVHATNHFVRLRQEAGGHLVASMAEFGLGGTPENLVGAIGGETFEVEEMYPAYLETAVRQGEKSAEVSFRYAWEAEKTHAAMFTKAKEAADGGNDLALGPVQICDVCGWTHEGEAPDECPICKAKKDRFRAFE
jgi:rubrerythrin